MNLATGEFAGSGAPSFANLAELCQRLAVAKNFNGKFASTFQAVNAPTPSETSTRQARVLKGREGPRSLGCDLPGEISRHSITSRLLPTVRRAVHPYL